MTEAGMLDSGKINLGASLQPLINKLQTIYGTIVKVEQELARNGVRVTSSPRPAATSLLQRLTNAQERVNELNRQLALLQKLVVTSALLTSSLELDRVLQEMMDIIVSLTGAERAYVMVKDKATGELKILAARNWDKQTIEQNEMIFSRSIVGHVIVSGEPILTTNAQGDERFQNNESVAANQLRSIICVPMTVRGETLGAVYADNRAIKALFKKEIIPIVTAFANQSAIAIENAQLYGQVKKDLDEAQTVIQRLQIRIDESKAGKQIDEIEDSEFFKKLRDSARISREEIASDLDRTLNQYNQSSDAADLASDAPDRNR